jgi:hypothetical protein
MADGYDVIVFDGPVSLGMPRSPELPRDFCRPSVLVGVVGTRIAQLLDLKIDWY